MKKLLLSLAVVSLVTLTACNKEAKPTENADATTTEQIDATAEGTEATATETTEATSEAPKFADAEAQQYVDDYAKFVKEYTEAYKAKDMTKIAELSKGAQEWAAKATSVSQKLANDTEQAKAFAEYTGKLGQDMAAAISAQ